MKTLICTNCLKTVSVADAAPGTDVNCPECGKSFAVPAGYTPAVASAPVPAPPPPPPLAALPPVIPPPPPPAPAGYVPPAPPSPPVVPPPPTLSPGYTRSRGFTVNPKRVAWMPAICLTLVVFMSFVCPWVGSYPAGHAVHSQGLWRAAFGNVNRNLKLEEMMTVKGGWLDLVKSNWEVLIPALLALMVAMVVAWADRRLPSLNAAKFPPPLRWIASLWSRRRLIVGVLTAFALALITIQAINGFGMEKAIKKSVADRFADERKDAGASAAAQAKVDFKIEEEVAKYAVEYTTWAYLSFALLALAVLAAIARWALDRRGNKPPPRFLIEY